MKGVKHYTEDGEYNGPTHKMPGDKVHTGKKHSENSKPVSHKKGGPFKMYGKSPMMKKLIGKQNNLPEELKAKIIASPAKKYKSDAQRKAVHASKAEKAAPTRKYSPMKQDKGKKLTPQKTEKKYRLMSGTKKNTKTGKTEVDYFKVSGGSSTDGGKTFAPTVKTKISESEYNRLKGN